MIHAPEHPAQSSELRPTALPAQRHERRQRPKTPRRDQLTNITFTSTHTASPIRAAPACIGNLLGWQLAVPERQNGHSQGCPVWRVPQQSPANRSPTVVVPAKRAHDPSSGPLRFSRGRCEQAWKLWWARRACAGKGCAGTRKPGTNAAATLSEKSTRSNLERVVRVIDSAASSNDLGGSPAPMKDHLPSGAARRTLCGRRQSSSRNLSTSAPRKRGIASVGTPCGCVSSAAVSGQLRPS